MGDKTNHVLVKLVPGDIYTLGIGNFNYKKQKLGVTAVVDGKARFHIIRILYIKGHRLRQKRWWQFWIRKKRLAYVCEYIGEE